MRRHQLAPELGLRSRQASFFFYDISNFIFGALTGELREELQEVIFTQGDSQYVGADMALSFHLSPRWRVHVGGGLVSAN